VGTLFQLDYDLFLYDVTSVYFEGKGAGMVSQARGVFEGPSWGLQAGLYWLVVSREGFPLGYEVFAGNRTECDNGAEESGAGDGGSVWEGRIGYG